MWNWNCRKVIILVKCNKRLFYLNCLIFGDFKEIKLEKKIKLIYSEIMKKLW